MQNVLTWACYVPPVLYKPSKGCNITGYVSNFYLLNQKKNGIIDPNLNNGSDPVIQAKNNAM